MNAPRPVHPTQHTSWVKYIAAQMERSAWMIRKGEGVRGAGVYEHLHDYVKKHGPSGSGIDRGVVFSSFSTPLRLVFDVDFHHMDEHGSYDGWTSHKVIVTPTFGGFDVRVTGSNRNQIKDYLGDTFHHWLGEVVEHPALIENN